MLFRNFGQAHPRATVFDNGSPVDVERCSADSPAFQFRSTHSSSNSLDDQTLFEFGNGTHNHDDRSTKRTGRVDIFPQTDELDVEVTQFVEHFQEMADTPGHPIESSNEHDVKTISSSIRQKLIKAWSLRLRTGNCVGIFVCDFKSALFCEFAQVQQLRFGMLVRRGNAAINCCSLLHFRSVFLISK